MSEADLRLATDSTSAPVRHVLQELEFADPAGCGPTRLFVDGRKGGVTVDALGASVHVDAFAEAQFDTYFNVFSLAVWARATRLHDVTLELDLAGTCEVELVNHVDGRPPRTVALVRTAGPHVEVSVPIDRCDGGIVAARVRAGDVAVRIDGGRWTTATPWRRDVRLGVGITTFNRPQYLTHTLATLDRYARTRVNALDGVEIQVVDNAANLELDASDYGFALRVVPNRNLGGAGGFARNLVEFRRRAWATHVLFMDDDIRFSPWVIDRIRAYLRLAADSSACLSGAMLDELTPSMQSESGAKYDARSVYPIRPLRSGLALDDPATLLENIRDVGIEYGAWWCFAFPLALTDRYPLPVFVRGDDVAFSLAHARGRIEAMNGVGVWHQPFETKNTPMMSHLEFRNLPLVSLLSDPGYCRTHFCRRFVTHAARSLIAMKYTSAEAIFAGTRDFLAGPDRWLQLDHEVELDRLRAYDGESPTALPHGDVPPLIAAGIPVLRRVRTAASLISLGGHLVPPAVSRLRPRSMPIQWRSVSAPLFRERLVYYDETSGSGFVAGRDRRRFFRLARSLIALSWAAWRSFPVIAAAYRAQADSFTNETYWMAAFGSGADRAPLAERRSAGRDAAISTGRFDDVYELRGSSPPHLGRDDGDPPARTG